MKNIAIILASGTGNRFGTDIPKQFMKIFGKTILENCIEAFEEADKIDEIILVINPQYRKLTENILDKNSYRKISKLLDGGITRKDSSSIAIKSLASESEANVLIHDCARPFVSKKIINDCIDALKRYDAVCTAIQSTDTMIMTDENNIISKIPPRNLVMRAQTPQGFKLSLIREAHRLAQNDNNFTDDCGLVLKHRLTDIHVVHGEELNLKITYPHDLLIVEKLLKEANQS